MPAFSVPENLAFDDYTALIDGISDWLNRSDLEGSAPMMIALCEARLRRELQPFFAETSATVSSVDGVAALPTGCDIVRIARYDGGELRQVSAQAGGQYEADTAPRAYTLEAGAIRLWPSCDVAVEIVYQPKLARLSEASPTNNLLSEHPDLYFFGAMLFAEGYVANDPRASVFKSLWDEAIYECKTFLGRQRRTSVRLPTRAVIA
jgi:hypothetical protein